MIMEHKFYTESNFIIVEDASLVSTATSSISEIVQFVENYFQISHENYNFIYKDSDGTWCGVKFSSEYSPTFLPLRVKDKEEAKLLFIEKYTE